MIVVDTSALMAIALDEPIAERCIVALENSEDTLISAATAAEAMIAASRRGVDQEMSILLDDLEIVVVPLNFADTHRVADAYRRWGKGFHPAALNFGDCFAYALANERGCPLLFIGNDFAQTDVIPAL